MKLLRRVVAFVLLCGVSAVVVVVEAKEVENKK